MFIYLGNVSGAVPVPVEEALSGRLFIVPVSSIRERSSQLNVFPRDLRHRLKDLLHDSGTADTDLTRSALLNVLQVDIDQPNLQIR